MYIIVTILVVLSEGNRCGFAFQVKQILEEEKNIFAGFPVSLLLVFRVNTVSVKLLHYAVVCNSGPCRLRYSRWIWSHWRRNIKLCKVIKMEKLSISTLLKKLLAEWRYFADIVQFGAATCIKAIIKCLVCLPHALIKRCPCRAFLNLLNAVVAWSTR